MGVSGRRRAARAERMQRRQRLGLQARQALGPPHVPRQQARAPAAHSTCSPVSCTATWTMGSARCSRRRPSTRAGMSAGRAGSTATRTMGALCGAGAGVGCARW